MKEQLQQVQWVPKVKLRLSFTGESGRPNLAESGTAALEQTSWKAAIR
jgi:hypothetical protein